MTITATTLTTDHVMQSFSQFSLIGLAPMPAQCPQQKKLKKSKYH
jgi:hypothetical protein